MYQIQSILPIVDGKLLAGKHILHGSEGHDGAKDGVGREQDELTVWLEAVVHLVSKGRVVPEGGRGFQGKHRKI